MNSWKSSGSTTGSGSSNTEKTGKKFGFGLNVRKKNPSVISTNKPKSSKLFDNDEDDGESIQNSAKAAKAPIFSSSSSSSSLHMVKNLQLKALEEDPTIFSYDEVYDQIASAPSSKKSLSSATDSAAAKKQGPKYIGNLLASASLRKLEYERVKERQVQRERQAEREAGIATEEEEKFVTSAYREKMKQLEEYEREQNRLERLESKRKVDFTSFYRGMLEQGIGFGGAHQKGTDEKPVSLSSQKAAQIEKDNVKVNESKAPVEIQLENVNEYNSANEGNDTEDYAQKDNEKVVEEERTSDDNVKPSSSDVNPEDNVQIPVPLEPNEQVSTNAATNSILQKRNDSSSVQSAKERYLARKKAKTQNE